MDSNQTVQEAVTSDEHKGQQQPVSQNNEQRLQSVPPQTVVQGRTLPRYPTWPTSKPGPMTTPPLPGQKPINALRSEQMTEVDYNQETGTPAVTETAFTSPKRRKERL